MRVVWREVPASKVFQTCLLNGNGTYTCYDYMNGKITHPFLLGVGGGGEEEKSSSWQRPRC